MRRIICLLLASLLFLLPLGCADDKSSMTLRFYYPRVNYGYNKTDGRLLPESAIEEHRNDVPYRSARQVIGIYLQGPVDPALMNPFPAGTELVGLSLEENILYLTLTDPFSELTGIPMIMACSCLAKTAMNLTNATEARIRCESALLDGETTITIRAESVFFDDPALWVNSQ